MKDNHGDVRREYLARALDATDLDSDPLVQFSRWLSEAEAAQLTDATAMTLATAGGDGVPAARIVLLKHHDSSGLVFYSDYRSLKGQHLAQNPYAEVLFYWRELERQVRIRGEITKVSREDSENYFQTRPRESQVSALASEQSAIIDSRRTLEARAEYWRDQPDPLVPADQWGGYRLIPTRYEFWQGRANRLHDRFIYTVAGPHWQIERLQP